jgi:RNA polymerase sigma-70 factor (ECF subfamily)
MSDERSKNELIAHAVAGDRMATGRLLLDHARQLKQHLAPRIPKSLARLIAVDDILQDTFIQAMRDIRQYQMRPDATFYNWLRTIADHRLQDALEAIRRKKRGADFRQVDNRSSRWTKLSDILADRGPSPISVIVRNEMVSAIQVGIAVLPEEQRTAVSLHCLDGRSVEETAAAICRSPAAVRGLIYRAKQSLRSTLKSSSRWFDKK